MIQTIVIASQTGLDTIIIAIEKLDTSNICKILCFQKKMRLYKNIRF